MGKNEVTVKEEATVVAAETPAMAVDISPSDMMVPYLKVIQSLADEVTPGKDKYNKDVRPGDIYDSVTRMVFKDAKVIICGVKKYYAEWTPEVRGKLVAKHKPDSAVVTGAVKVEKVSDKGNNYFTLQTAGGNDLIETYGVVMLVKMDGLTMPAVLTLSKTGFIVGKQLSTMLVIHQNKGVPVFTLSTSTSSNSKGSWFKPAFAFDSYETDESVIKAAQGMLPYVDGLLFNNLNSDEGSASVNTDEDNEIF